MKYIDPKNRETVFNWIIDLYLKNFTKVPLVINYHRWMGAGKDWAGEENFDPDSKRLLDSACEKGFSLRHDAFVMREYYGQWERNYAKALDYEASGIAGRWLDCKQTPLPQ